MSFPDTGTDVVVTDEPVQRPARRTTPKWETEARDRIRAGIRRYSRPLNDLVERDANEGDTRLLVTDFLCDVLGYDKYADLTTEYEVRGDYADYGVRIDKELAAFIEVKRVATKLKIRHLRQVEMYGVNEGVEWVVLTNGARWQVYHLSGGLPVEVQLAIEIDLLGSESLTKKTDKFFYLSRESFKRRRIDELWQKKRATSPTSLGNILLTEPVVSTVRKLLRRQTGYVVSSDEITQLLRDTVIRPECLIQ